jgi:hypothetical protein
VPLAALVVLVLNDHVLKREWPGAVSGKLSDITGIIFLPLTFVALIELVRWLLGRPWLTSGSMVTACVAATIIGFAAVKGSPTVGRAYGAGLGWVRWPVMGSWRRVRVAHDLTDLWVLPSALVAEWDAYRAIRRRMPSRRVPATPGSLSPD